MNIVFLYSELMPNLIPVFKVLIYEYSADIHVVYWDYKKKTPYVPVGMRGLTLYPRSEYGCKEIQQLLRNVGPDLIYAAGWMDYAYLRIIPEYRRKGVPIIVGLDDWWQGTPKQRIASFCSPILTKVFYSHAWVSGPRQYEYAKRLGFIDSTILQNLLTADFELFAQGCDALRTKSKAYPNVFLYIGRFSPEKGTELLAAGFEKYRTAFGGTWNLICIGNGPLANVLSGRPNIQVLDFSSQSELVEAMKKSGVFVMPSLRDFSPLAVHEAACAGMPMILSSNVGNIPLFMIHDYNGFVFNSGSVEDLAKTMYRVSNTPPEKLVLMGERSHKLSYRVNPELSAASLVSCIQNL